MRTRSAWRRLLATAAGALALATVAPTGGASGDSPAHAPAAHAAHAVDENLVHDHAPRHGGVVGMAGTRHVEIVLGRDVVRVYLSDLHRVPLSLDGVSGTVTLRDAAAPEAPRTIALTRRGDALEAPLAKLAGPTVDARIELKTPGGPLLIEFTLPVTMAP